MSVLQRLENSYLAILRFVVILISGLLLVVAIVLAISSLTGLRSEPPIPAKTLEVSPEKVVKDIVTAKKGEEGNPAPMKRTGASSNSEVEVAMDRVAAAVIAFVRRHSEGSVTLPREKVIEVIRRRLDAHRDQELKLAFANGLANTTERVLADPRVIAMMGKSSEGGSSASPLNVANSVLTNFEAEFAIQIEQQKLAEAQSKAAYLEKREAAGRNLYLAGGTFGLFLLVVFLSIFIKIERNLRGVDLVAKRTA